MQRYGVIDGMCRHDVSMESGCPHCELEQGLEGLPRAELVERLKLLAENDSPHSNHYMADAILLRIINDPEVTEAFDVLHKWYS